MTEVSADIVPAVKAAQSIPKEISADDFQKQLFSWFQDKGLMAELRSHLRVKMIAILKNASAENKVRNSFSPKLQAVNLLIAEYLLHKEYHYSLSVFSTEVPLTNEFQDYSLHEGRSRRYQFAVDDMWDILEILGITNDSEEGKDIFTNYQSQNNSEPLLTCVIRTLHSMKQNSKARISEINLGQVNIESKDIFLLRNISNLLVQARVSPKYISDITEQFSLIIKTEIDRITEQNQKECLDIKQRMKQDSRQRIEKCKRRVVDLENAFASERQRLQNELDKSKTDLKECALQLQNKTDDLTEKENAMDTKELQLVVKEDALIKREQLLTSKESNLAEREDRLHTELQALYIEKIKINDLKHRVQNSTLHKSEKFCLNPQRYDSHRNLPEQKSSTTLDKAQQTAEIHNIENVLLKQTIRQLHLENESLRSQMNNQNVRIDELNQQTNNLSVEISELRKNISGKSNQHSNHYQSPPFPLQYQHLPASAGHSNAAGDDRNRPMYTNVQQHLGVTHVLSVKPITPHDSSCSSPPEESFTDEILRAAKARLMHLERESRTIERNYRRYRKLPQMAGNVCEGQEQHFKMGVVNPSLVDRLNSNIAMVRENISRLLCEPANMDEGGESDFDQVTTCTATPCKGMEFTANSYNSLIADIPGEAYNNAESEDLDDIRRISVDVSESEREIRVVEADVGSVRS